MAALAAVALACACGGTESSNCPNISGTWKVTSHCVSSYVGQTFPVAQSGCNFTTGDPFSGFTGTVNANNQVTIVSPQGASTLSCNGAVAGSVIAFSCQPPCSVTIQKQ
jgi:hypothetical protein